MTRQVSWDAFLQPLQAHFGVEWSKDLGGLPTSPVQCFTLRVPWCETWLNWKVILSISQHAAPDFVFDDPCFFPLLNKSGSKDFRELLNNWRISDAASLTKILAELLGIFRFYHFTKMKALGDTRLQFELDTMQFSGNTELLLTESEAHIGVELSGVDISPLEEFIELPAQDTTATRKHMFMLYVVFPVGTSSVPQAQIKVPEYLTAFFPPNITSPPWTQNACLAEFQPSAVDSLARHITLCVQKLQSGILLLDHLEEVFGHPLERTTGIPQTSCYLIAHGTVLFVLFVEIGIGFPEKKPTLSVQSVRKPTVDGPFKVLAFDRWSPRWNTHEMAVRIATFLKEEAPKLKLGGHI